MTLPIPYETISTLLSLPLENRQEPLLQRIQSGQLDFVRSFINLDHEHIFEHQNLAYRASIQAGMLSFALEIIHMGQVHYDTPQELTQALYISLLELDEALFLSLLPRVSLDPESRGMLLSVACEQGNREIVQSLLAHGPIAQESHIRALERACATGHFELLDLLSPLSQLDLYYRERALTHALNQNLLDIIRDLILSGPISHSTLLVLQARALSSLPLHEILTHAVVDSHTIPIPHDLTLFVDDIVPDPLAIHQQPQALPEIIAQSPVSQNQPSHILLISQDKLKENPLVYLEDASKGFSGVAFMQKDGTISPGIDVGGLSKQFLHSLIEELKEKKLLQASEQGLPIVYSGCNLDIYSQLGRLICHIRSKNASLPTKIKLASIFSPKTFELFKILLQPSATELDTLINLMLHNNDPSQKTLCEFLNKSVPSPSDAHQIAIYLKSIYGDDIDFHSLNDIKQLCVTSLKESIYPALKAFLDGFSEDFKADIMAKGQSLFDEVFGSSKPAASDIIGKFHLNDARVSEKVDWIKEKLQQEELLGSDWPMKFLVCVTAQSCLPSQSIIINAIDDVVCRAHTCSNTLDIPLTENYPHIDDPLTSPKEKFLLNLDILLSQTSFDIA